MVILIFTDGLIIFIYVDVYVKPIMMEAGVHTWPLQ